MQIAEHLSDAARASLGRFSVEVLAHDFRREIRELDDEALAAKCEHIAITIHERSGHAETALRELAICTAEGLRRMAKPTKKDGSK